MGIAQQFQLASVWNDEGLQGLILKSPVVIDVAKLLLNAKAEISIMVQQQFILEVRMVILL